MKLKGLVESVLVEQKRSLSWLATEMDRTVDGFRMSLEKETIKYSDLKKMRDILNMPIQYFFEQNTYSQSIRGDGNNQAGHSISVSESAEVYKTELHFLREAVIEYKQELVDKQKVIDYLISKK